MNPLDSFNKHTPIRIRPFAPWPHYEEDEISAVSEVLRSGKVNYWTGDECRHFEKEYAEYVGCRHAIALANGTVALELALYAIGVGPGDEVVTTSRTFIASASCAVMRGAIPVMADVDPESQNLTAKTISEVVTPKTKAIVVVHLAGWPCAMDEIMTFAEKRGLAVIEDCAQANGATYHGKPVGSFGHVSAFSFCQDKIITTGGEGGMLLTNDSTIWEKSWAYKDHGKSYDAVFRRQHPPGFRWVHESFGTNWRMTEMQAAIGRLQLKKLDQWIAKRRAHATALNTCFCNLKGLRVTPPPKGVGHAYYKYYAFIRPEKLKSGWSRDRIIEAITAEGVPCYAGGCSEIYLEKAFADAGQRPASRHATAKTLGENSLMFLVHPTLSDDDIIDTCRAVAYVMTQATT